VNRQHYQDVGRFARVDPKAPTTQAVAIGSYGDPQSLNRFAYSRNDPQNLLDPLGLEVAGFLEIWPGCLAIKNVVEADGIYSYWEFFGSTCDQREGRRDQRDGGDTRGAGGSVPKRKKAKFKLAKLKACADSLFGAEIRNFDTGGNSVDVYGPATINNQGNSHLYQVTFDFSSTGAQIAAMPPTEPNVTWVFGAHFSDRPFIGFIANDIAAFTGNSDPILIIATQVHELAHALAQIGGVKDDPTRNNTDGAGDRMENCVFGGVVGPDGYVQ